MLGSFWAPYPYRGLNLNTRGIIHATKLILNRYASEQKSAPHLSETEIDFYIICGPVFSYSSSDANNTYIIANLYMMDSSHASDIMKQQLYWLRKKSHHKKLHSAKMPEKQGLFPFIHPPKSVDNGIPHCKMLCHLCTCRCPSHGSTAVCRDSKRWENGQPATLQHLNSSKLVVSEQGIAQFHTSYRNEYIRILCSILDHRM